MRDPLLPDGDRLLTPAEVASVFRVDPKTVTRWAKARRIKAVRTLGGHNRFWESDIRRLLEGETHGDHEG
jgi:excisionase family DNA binding protein